MSYARYTDELRQKTMQGGDPQAVDPAMGYGPAREGTSQINAAAPQGGQQMSRIDQMIAAAEQELAGEAEKDAYREEVRRQIYQAILQTPEPEQSVDEILGPQDREQGVIDRLTNGFEGLRQTLAFKNLIDGPSEAELGRDSRYANTNAVAEKYERFWRAVGKGTLDYQISGTQAMQAFTRKIAPDSKVDRLTASFAAALSENNLALQRKLGLSSPLQADEDPLSMDSIIQAVGEGTPQVVAAAIAGLATAPLGAAVGSAMGLGKLGTFLTTKLAGMSAFAATSAAPVVGQTFNASLAETGDPDLAADEAIAAGAFTYAINNIPGAALLARNPLGQQVLGKISKNAAAKYAARVTWNTVTEGATEIAEEVAQEFLAEHMRRGASMQEALAASLDPKHWRNYALAGIAGGVLGAGAAVATAPFVDTPRAARARLSQAEAPIEQQAASGTVPGVDPAKPVTRGVPKTQQSRDAYVAKAGIPKAEPQPYVEVEPARAQAIADAYEAMQHDPADETVRASYDALKSETKAQFEHTLGEGLVFEFTSGDPYESSADMIADVGQNNRLRVFLTTEGSLPADHPLAEKTGINAIDAETGESVELTYNDLFRAVHDYYGHSAGGYQFGPRGEENAWVAHARMFSEQALPAMTTETRGQNSWVNSGKHIRREDGSIPQKGEPDWIDPKDRPFAAQKAGILPEFAFEHAQVNIRRPADEVRSSVEEIFNQGRDETQGDQAEGQAQGEQESPVVRALRERAEADARARGEDAPAFREVGPETQDQTSMVEYARQRGVRIRFVEGTLDHPAATLGQEIAIDANKRGLAGWALALHELTHIAEARPELTRSWKALHDNLMQIDPEGMAAGVAEYRAIAEASGRALSEQDARSESVAVMGERVVRYFMQTQTEQGRATLVRLANERPGLLVRLARAIRRTLRSLGVPLEPPPTGADRQMAQSALQFWQVMETMKALHDERLAVDTDRRPRFATIRPNTIVDAVGLNKSDTAMVTIELVPNPRYSPLNIENRGDALKRQYTQEALSALVDPDGNDKLLRELGVEVVSTATGEGWYNGVANPGFQQVVIRASNEVLHSQYGILNPILLAKIRRYGRIINEVYAQDSIGWHRPHVAASPELANATAVAIFEPGAEQPRMATAAEMGQIKAEMARLAPEILTKHGIEPTPEVLGSVDGGTVIIPDRNGVRAFNITYDWKSPLMEQADAMYWQVSNEALRLAKAGEGADSTLEALALSQQETITRALMIPNRAWAELFHTAAESALPDGYALEVEQFRVDSGLVFRRDEDGTDTQTYLGGIEEPDLRRAALELASEVEAINARYGLGSGPLGAQTQAVPSGQQQPQIPVNGGRFYHFSGQDLRKIGIARAFAGTARAGEERASIRRDEQGRVVPESAAVHLYPAGRKPEQMFAQPGVWLHAIEAAGEWKNADLDNPVVVESIVAKRSELGLSGTEGIRRAAAELGYSTIHRHGLVQAVRDIPANMISQAVELDAELAREFGPSGSLVLGDLLQKADSVQRANDARARFAVELGDGAREFYPKSLEILDAKFNMKGKANARDLRAMLLNNGVKADEMEWLGINSYLDRIEESGQPVLIADLVGQIDTEARSFFEERIFQAGEGNADISERDFEFDTETSDPDSDWIKQVAQDSFYDEIREELIDSGDYTTEYETEFDDGTVEITSELDEDRLEKDAMAQAIERAEEDYYDEPNFYGSNDYDYTISGNSGYVTIESPYGEIFEGSHLRAFREALEHARRTLSGGHPEFSTYREYIQPGGEDSYAEILLKMASRRTGSPFGSPHWSGEEDVVVSLRTTDRTNIDGESVFFLEEVQSDLHQRAATQGGFIDRDRADELQAEYETLQADTKRKMADIVAPRVFDILATTSAEEAGDAMMMMLRQTSGLSPAVDWESVGSLVGQDAEQVFKSLGDPEQRARRSQELERLFRARTRSLMQEGFAKDIDIAARVGVAALASIGRAHVVASAVPADLADVDRELTALAATLNQKRGEAAKMRQRNIWPTPYHSDYHELAIRRALQIAHENGHDGIAWTPGQMQAARYNLGNMVWGIDYKKTSVDERGGGSVPAWEITALDHSGDKLQTKIYRDEELGEAVGSEVAKRIRAGGESGSLRGTQLTNETRGFYVHYDQKMPSYAKRLAKKYGAKLEYKITEFEGIPEDLSWYYNPEDPLMRLTKDDAAPAFDRQNPDLRDNYYTVESGVNSYALPISGNYYALRAEEKLMRFGAFKTYEEAAEHMKVVRQAEPDLDLRVGLVVSGGYAAITPTLILTPQMRAAIKNAELPMFAVDRGVAGRPDLGNPGMTGSSRAFVDEVDEQRNIAGEPQVREDDAVFEEARSRLVADRAGERARLIEKIGRGEILTDTETVMAKRISGEDADAALKSGGEQELADAIAMVWAYRHSGTLQARSFRLRRDELMRPGERWRQAVAAAVSGVDGDTRTKLAQAYQKLAAAREAGKADAVAQAQKTIDSIVKQEAGKAAKIRRNLKAAGVEPSLITDATFDDPVTAANIMRAVQTAKAGPFDMAFEYWRNAILSFPPTHILNISTNTAFGAWEAIGQRAIEAAVNAMTGTKEGAQIGELRLVGPAIMRGLARGARNAVRAFGTETPQLRDQIMRAGGEVAGPGQKREVVDSRAAIPGRLGRFVRAPGDRALLFEDELFRGVWAEIEAVAQAYRIAKSEGLEGDAATNRISALTQDLASPAWEAALEYSDRLLFQTKLGNIGQMALKLRRDLPALSFIMPFVTTPVNVVKEGLKKTVAITPYTAYKAMRVGAVKLGLDKGTYEVTPREWGQMVSNNIVAWALLLAISELMDDEDGTPRITGQKDYQNLPKMSIRLGDTWYNYNRLDPFAVNIGLTVDMIRDLQDPSLSTPDALGGTLRHLVAQLGDKTFLSGIGDFYEAFFVQSQGGDSRLVKWASNFAASWVPNLVRGSLRSTDPYVRDSRIRREDDREGLAPLIESAATQTARAALPRVFGDNPIRYDWQGRPLQQRVGPAGKHPATDYIWRITVPVNRRPADAANELDRLLVNYNNAPDEAIGEWWPGRPGHRLSDRRGGMTNLTPAEYAEYVRRSGELASSRLQSMRLNADSPTAREIGIIQRELTRARRRVADDIIAERNRATD